MGEKRKIKFGSIISLKDLVTVFVRKKWLFIGFFLVTLIIGLSITLIKTPVFQSSSTLKLNDVYYDENLYKYYPQEAKDLGIYAPGLDIGELEGYTLGNISIDIRSDEVFEEVLEKTNIDISMEELRNTLRTLIDRGQKIVDVIITFPVAEDSYEINKALINTYLSNNIDNKSTIIRNLIADIEKEIGVLEQEMVALDEKNSGDSKYETRSESLEIIINDLTKIKYNLENNKELYISNIEITREPVIPSEPVNADYLKNILIVIFVSIAVGLIAVYIPSIFTSLKD